MRALILTFALAACAQNAPLEATQACADLEFTGEYVEQSCTIVANDETLRVSYSPVAEGAQGGAVSIDVLGENGAALQTMLESDVSEYLPPSVQDVDGDGRGDILIARERGNVNTASGVWVFNGAAGAYRRVGEVSGVEIANTADGYVAVPARGGAAMWNVAFYQLDADGLHMLASVNVEGEELAGGQIRSTCSLLDAPGISRIQLSTAEAEAKFCAEPAAQVFAQ